MKKLKDLNKRVDIDDGSGNLKSVKAYELEESILSTKIVETNKILIIQMISTLQSKKLSIEKEINDLGILINQMED